MGSVVGGGTCSSSGNNIKTVATITINTVTNTASTNTTTAVVSNSNNSIAVVDVVPPEEEEEVSSTTVVVATSVLPTTESSSNGVSSNSTATNIKDNTNNNDIESVIVSIRSLLVVGNGRLQGAIDMGVAERERLLDEHAFKLGKNRDEKKKGKRKRCEDEDYEINEDGVVKQPVKGDLESSSSSSKRTAKRKNDNNNKAEKNRINRRPVVPSNVSAGHYTVAESKAAYSHLTEYHRKKGWDNTGWWAKNG